MVLGIIWFALMRHLIESIHKQPVCYPITRILHNVITRFFYNETLLIINFVTSINKLMNLFESRVRPSTIHIDVNNYC